MGWIQTYTGKIFDIESNEMDICIEDIAHALAMLCRYNGHTKRFYSVAEHSYLVSLAIERHHIQNYSDSDALWIILGGHMHDSPEAYVSDAPGPIKHLITGFKKFEQILDEEITTQLNIPTWAYHHPLVKMADMRILATERLQVLATRQPRTWAVEENNILPYDDLEIEFWSPKKGEQMFLDRYYDLRSRIGVANLIKHKNLIETVIET